MKKILSIITFTLSIEFTIFFITSCANNKDKNEINNLTLKIETLKSENKELKETINLLKYPAQDRLKQIKKLITHNDLIKAQEEINQLRTLFPKSPEVQECKIQEEKIAKIKAKIKAEEEERIKALGFKALKEHSTVEVFYNKISIGQFSITKTFTFDAYDDRYFYRTADRGNKYISSRITITSTDKNPKLPVFYAYRINGNKLTCEGRFKLEFARWEDYATYLGNYTDNSNDFSKTSTIPFKIAIEVSDEVASSPLVIICRKQNCMVRNYDRFANPPVYYSIGDGCTYNPTLTLDDLKKGYAVVKILNKNKL
ncbi:hypothetical protein [Bacteroides fragilis]|uniref:hypothetical protein n=1 Tax=Bacteroides fragilis TaxID=817 RepID=UPI002454F739|nr:hypothetical protein [Bacteroides fragilis]